MTAEQIVTLVIAILGVLHGPLVTSLFSSKSDNDKGK